MTIRFHPASARRRVGAAMAGRAAVLCAALAAGLAWGPRSAPAQTNPPSNTRLYTVERVTVDVTAESAVAARGQAQTQAFAQALQTLEARLVPTSAMERIPRTDPNRLLRDFEVTDEKVSSTRYIGTLTVRFDPAKVRQFFWSANIPFSDAVSEPILVLPVFEGAGPPVLFESSTPWLSAWVRMPTRPRLVPFVVPTSDLEDLRAISAAQALGADADALGAIAARYGVGQVLIADATPAEKDGVASLNVRLLRVSREGSGTDSFDLTGQPGETLDALLDQAVAMTMTRIEDAWKLGAPQGAEHTLIATIPITSLGDWVGMRDRLQGMKSIRQVALKTLSPTQAQIVLHYSGETSALAAELATQGLALTPAPPGVEGWLLGPQAPVSSFDAGFSPAGTPSYAPQPYATQPYATQPYAAPHPGPTDPGAYGR